MRADSLNLREVPLVPPPKVSVQIWQLGPDEHERSSVARSKTLWPAARLTWANLPFLKPFSLESCGV